MSRAEDLSAWLSLKSAPELGVKTALKVVLTYGEPSGYVGVACHELYASDLISSKAKEHLKQGVLPENNEQILKTSQNYDIEFLPITCPDYPVQLKSIFSPPLILYYRGDLLASLSKPILAVVGTRKSSSYGREMTRKLLQPLVKRGICIVSGLAIGIDTIAHQCALEQGSSTLAVLAGGVDEIYPAMNKELARRITAQGALISEYEPCTKLERWNFPARNRIVSALSQSVFVVEGTIDSGALLTAKFALEQNREILALPGNINNPNAQGPNYLIKCGARVITCPEDLLQAFDLEPETAEQMELFPELSDNEKLIYESLKQAGRELGFDELMLQCKFSFGQLSIALLNLELKNLIAKASGNSYLCL